MAVPKGKMSRSRTRQRRSQWTAKPTTLIPVTVGGLEYHVPRRLVRAVQRGYIDPKTNNS